MNLIRRLTIRNCGITVKDIKAAVAAAEAKEPGSTAVLCKILGETTEAKTGQTDKGQYTALLGNFIGVNLMTGEQFKASKCILPNFISEGMAAALNTSQAVSFALEIGAYADDDAITGYVYNVRDLVETKPTDRMSELMALSGIAAPTPALSAPAAGDQQPAAPAKTAPAKSAKR